MLSVTSFRFAPGAFLFCRLAAKHLFGGPAMLLRGSGQFEQLPCEFTAGYFLPFSMDGELRLARFLHQFFGAKQGREVFGNSVKGGGPFVSSALFLSPL